MNVTPPATSTRRAREWTGFHHFTHTWLSEAKQGGDLMWLAGCRSRTMLGRYGARAAVELAQEPHKRLSPGDRL